MKSPVLAAAQCAALSATLSATLSAALFATLSAALLGACASPPPEHFYTLDPVAGNSQRVPGSSNLSIRIGPVTVPEMVDRPQLVVRSGANQVRLMESQRWAESLRSAIPRVIAGNLKRQWPDGQISSSDGAPTPVQVSVAVDILRFESTLGDAVELEARWRIKSEDRPGGKTDQSGSMTWREPVRGAGYEDLAAAHERTLASLSRQLATAISTIARAP